MALSGLRDPDQLPTGEPMKTINLTEILEYYDGIQIFAAQDVIGGHYRRRANRNGGRSRPIHGGGRPS